MISKLNQYGYRGLTVRGITIHNTGNEKSAKELFDELENSLGSFGCHFLVDEDEVIQILPLDWCAYHTGKGKDWGNNFTIAIEICRSQSDYYTYLKSQTRAIELVKKLMVEYHLSTKDIYFHHDFSNKTYCPHRILDIYNSKKNFIKEVF